MKYISFHGFNVKDRGRNTTDKLKPYLDIVDVDYGYMWLAKVRLCNACVAAAVINLIPEGSSAIAHSNGALIAVKAAELHNSRLRAQFLPTKPLFKKLILINPALDRDYEFPEGQHVDVYYTPKDTAVLAARFIPWSDWGSMGRNGYEGTNSQVYNYNSFKLFNSKEHSDVFNSAEDLALHIKGGE